MKIGECWILTGFIVLELEKEPRDPIILNRTFLATTRTIVNIQKSNIDLHLNDLVMKFDVWKMIKKPIIDGKTFSIDSIGKITNEIMQEVHSEDPLEIILVQEEDELGYNKIKITGFARSLDSSESARKPSISNIKKMQQKGPIFSVESGYVTKVQRSIDLSHGSIDPSCSNPILDTTISSQINQSNIRSIYPNVLKPIPSANSP